MELRDKNGLTEAEFLAQYRPGSYPRPSVTADIVLLSQEPDGWRVLLIRRGGHPYLGCWALPGGFSNAGESVDATAARELEEETGLSGLPLQQLGLFSTPGRDPRTWVMSEAYVSIVEAGRLQVRPGDDASQAGWFTIHTQREGEELELELTGAGECLRARLEISCYLGIDGPVRSFRLVRRGPLAFDHAEILACALERAGLIV